VSVDWVHEHRYEQLIKVPAIRSRIDRLALRSKAGLTGEDFLQLGEKALSPLTAGIPISKIATASQALWSQLGVRSGKQREALFEQPIGLVLTATLCSLASAGLKIQQIEQRDDGCILSTILPSDLFSLAGELLVQVSRTPEGTRWNATTEISGQIYDWGKSNRWLTSLQKDVEQTLVTLKVDVPEKQG